jgi:hypothetical protein
MKYLIIILLFAFQIKAVAQQKNTPCPFPKFKKGQTSRQVNEETRIYIECKKQLKLKEDRERRDARERERLRQNDEEVQGK